MNHRNQGRKYRVVTFALLLATGLFTSLPVFAQASGGTISGTVTDVTNAVIPNAQITIKNLGTGEKRTLDTDKAGFYNAPNLLPGHYQVSATAKGFKTQIQSG